MINIFYPNLYTNQFRFLKKIIIFLTFVKILILILSVCYCIILLYYYFITYIRDYTKKFIL